MALAWLAASAQAEILDPFNYTPGMTLAGRSPFAPLTWVAAGPAGPQQARVQAGVLQWPGLSNSVPNRVNITAGNGPSSLFVFGTMDVADPYPPVISGTVYFSFILRVTDLTGLGAGGNYFAGFTPDQMGGAVAPANVFTRVLLRTSGAGYNIGLVKSSALVADFQWDTRVFNVGDTVLLVGAYIFSGENADISRLWINPSPTTFCSPTPPAYTLQSTDGVDATQLASVAYMQRPTPAQPTAMLTDELRVSQFWDGVVRPGWDYPDAPGAYHTLYADNAARHTVVPGISMGALIDVECDGLPTVPADGDDLDNLDDGDGVGGTAGLWVPGGTKNITVTVSVNGKIDAYFDWNKNNMFDPAEKVFASVDVFAAAPNTLTVSVPSSADTGFTYARFRFSTAGGLGAVGPAPDGEVEDYRIQVQAPPPPPPDLGLAVLVSPSPVTDASNVTYAITVTNKGAGAASGVIASNPLPFGLSFVSATASQGSCSNGAAGVQCALGALPPGGSATVNVVGVPDFNVLAGALNIPEMQERIEISNTVSVVAAETDATPADNLAAVIVAIVPQRDFGDAPAPPYPTLLPTAARHRLGALRFGTLIDAESNGLPVDLDDTTGVNDEFVDGFNLPTGGFYVGGWTTINIQVSGPAGGYIELWIDIDGVPGWGAADHVLTAAWHPGGGAVMPFAILIPPGTTPGLAWARARVHKNPAGLPTTGYGGFGEVVDFQANILPAAVDLVAVANPAEITVTEGDPLTLTVTVSNRGPSTATDVVGRIHFPPGATLENFTLSQGTGQMEGTNLVARVGTLAPNGVASVTFTAGTSNMFAGLADEFMWWCFDYFAVEIELAPEDNMHHGAVGVVAARDFGDAPDATVGPIYAYPTRMADNGARHRIVGPFFGGSPAGVANRDRDPDGMPTLNADGDDLLDANDDEQGIQFLDPIFPGATGVRVRINAPLGGTVDAWCDFNRNGRWGMGAPEQIFTSLVVAAGTSDYTFNVPAGAVTGATYARFRISTVGGLAPSGYATNGEVQDLTLTILPAIDIDIVPVGATSLQFDDNEPFPLALRVSNKGSNTATGVQLSATLPEHVTVQSIISSNGSCQVNGSNVICQLASLAPGQNSQFGFLLEVVADELPGDDFYNLGDLTVMATAAESDVRVEDNQFVVPTRVLFARDWGDAPAGYPVTDAGNGARHRASLLTPLRLGTGWDRESDGTPSPGADYDDTHGATPDDEAGVVFVSTTGTITVDVTVTGDGHVDAWMNFNRDVDWEDAGEQILISEPFNSETRRFSITVPAGTTAGDFVSRWRVSKDGGLTSKDPGGRGEVEDYVTSWEPEEVAHLDFGDAPEDGTLFPVTKARNGANHEQSPLMLGARWDAELDGQPSIGAIDDNTYGIADEEGVTFPAGGFVAGTVQDVIVEVTGYSAVLDAWVDWDGDLEWDDPYERIATNFPVHVGLNTLTVWVPMGIPSGNQYARFRLSTNGTLAAPLPQDGPATDGEVEDYQVHVQGDRDNPNPVYFAGLPHTALSNATVAVTSNGLQVANLGSGGQDGVRINLGRSQGWRASVTREPVQVGSIVYSVNIIGLTAGMSNQTLATMRLERQGSNLLFSADFSALGASQYTAAFYDTNGTQVNNTRPFQNLEVVPLFPDCPDGYIPDCEWVSFLDSATGGMHVGFLLCRGCLRFPDDTTFPGDGPILCLLTPTAPTRTAEYLSAVEIRGGSTTPSNSTSILLTSEATRQFGLWHRGVGGARLDTAATNGPPTLRVRNLGSSGEDGIETIIGGGNDIWDAGDEVSLPSRVVQLWEGLRGLWLTGSNSHVRWTATGRVTGSVNEFENLGDLTLFNGEQGTMLYARFDGIGATQAVVEVFNGPTFVGSLTLPVGNLGSYTWSTNASGVSRVSMVVSDGSLSAILTTRPAQEFTPANGLPALTGDRFRITALNPTTTVEGLRSLITRGANVESFALNGFNTAAPQRPRLSAPRLLPNGHVMLPIATEADVAYQVETSSSVNGTWTPIGQVMGTDGMNETEFEDTVLRISNRVRLFRVRIR